MCTNTGKIGVYFSTYPLQSISMVLEYQKNMELGIYRTREPILVYEGKYSFREIHPRYYTPNHKLALGMYPSENEMISHINSEMLPIFDIPNIPELPNIYNSPLTQGEGEVFLTQDSDLKNIDLIETYKINYAQLKKDMVKIYKNIGYFPFRDFNFYLANASIKKITCSRSKTRKRR